MPFGQPGMMGSALMGATQNRKMQNTQQKQQMQQKQQAAGGGMTGGIGPSMGAMGSMMGNKMGQQAQKPGMRMGQMAGALGAGQPILGGGQADGAVSRRMGRQFKGPMQPRQDMYEPPQIGMSNIQLPPEQPMMQPFGSSMEQPAPEQAMMPEQADPRQMQNDRMQQALQIYGPKNSALRRGGGIGPRFM